MAGLNVASAAFAVTPSDSADLPSVAYGLIVGGAGNLKVDCGNDVGTQSERVTLTFTGVVAGQLIPLRVIRVYATGTTATNIAALEE